MSGPYITTVLSTTINLNARQMDNRIYKNLKDNLVKKLEGKCYRSYGFISKIYDIQEYSIGKILPENPMADATFKVKFTCKLCFPLRNKKIVCKIMKMNNMFINAQNGPITMIITMDRINNDIFYQEPKTGKLIMKKGDKIQEIVLGTYIVATIRSKTFNDMDTIIMSLGELNDIATDEEINNSFKQEHIETELQDYDEYIDAENITEKDSDEMELESS